MLSKDESSPVLSGLAAPKYDIGVCKIHMRDFVTGIDPSMSLSVASIEVICPPFSVFESARW